jgi:hypothetical protein
VNGLGFLLLVTAVLDRTAGHPSMGGLPPRRFAKGEPPVRRRGGQNKKEKEHEFERGVFKQALLSISGLLATMARRKRSMDGWPAVMRTRTAVLEKNKVRPHSHRLT